MSNTETTGRKKFTFSGIPGDKTQRSWKYTLTPDKDGGGVLTVSVGEKHLKWRVPAEISQTEPTDIKRLPDGQHNPKFKTREGEMSGVLQVHKSSAGEIYATMQDGKTNSSIRISQNDGGKWNIQPVAPKKNTGQSALQFVSKITKEAGAADMPADWGSAAAASNPPLTSGIIDKITYPLTSPNPLLGALAGAGVGAVGGGLLNAFRRIRNTLSGESERNKIEPSFGSSMLMGAGVGAGISGAWHALSTNRPPGSIPWGFRGQLAPKSAVTAIDAAQKPVNDLEDIQKLNLLDRENKIASFGKRAYGIDYRAIAANIRTDPALAPFERDRLLADVTEASRRKIPVDTQTLIAAGFSALASYILSRIFNAGTFGRAAVTALGGFLGGYAFAPDNNTQRIRGGISIYE
jgi:hypothetical protein